MIRTLSKKSIILVASVLAVSSCSDSSKQGDAVENTDEIEKASVDYDSWPLAKVGSSLNSCIDIYGTASYLYWIPTESEANINGYGFVDDQLARLEDSSPEAIVVDCTKSKDRVGALSLASRAATMKEGSSKAYEAWSECMTDEGYKDLAYPSDRGTLLAQKLYPPLDGKTESIEITKDRANNLKTFEVSMARADIDCQANTLGPAEAELIADQNAVIDSAPSDTAELLRG